MGQASREALARLRASLGRGGRGLKPTTPQRSSSRISERLIVPRPRLHCSIAGLSNKDRGAGRRIFDGVTNASGALVGVITVCCPGVAGRFSNAAPKPLSRATASDGANVLRSVSRVRGQTKTHGRVCGGISSSTSHFLFFFFFSSFFYYLFYYYFPFPSPLPYCCFWSGHSSPLPWSIPYSGVRHGSIRKLCFLLTPNSAKPPFGPFAPCPLAVKTALRCAVQRPVPSEN